ncbi:hypothetical protein AFLA70_65g003940 [Aspergillus flavus AF70]|nr:hypothetical protein AFLA70_65g003940 [Aspergillus flavus AF70]
MAYNPQRAPPRAPRRRRPPQPPRYPGSHIVTLFTGNQELWFVQVKLDPGVVPSFEEYENAVKQGKAELTLQDNRKKDKEGQMPPPDGIEKLLDGIGEARLKSQRLPHIQPAFCPR